jgi:type IV secretory pathway VirB10-like protein
MADDKQGVEQTGDLLRPVRSRPTGTKAIAWYGIVGVLATIAIVYLVGIFAAPKHESAQAATLSQQEGPQQGGDAFRYSGHVAHDGGGGRRTKTGPAAAATLEPSSHPTAAPTPLIQVPRNDVATTVVGNTSTNVPDVSDAIASRVRVALPTAAPDDGTGNVVGQVGRRRQGIVVVYGAPNTAATPVPAAEAAAAPPGAQVALEAPVVPRPASTDAPSGGLAGLRGETMPGYRRAPLARYMVSAGTPITVQLDVAVESDVAGPVVAHVVRDVVDQLSGQTLIPGGTKALGDYTGLGAGQSRLAFVWRRFVFPDRSSFALDKVPALDDEGRVGVGGKLDRREGPLVRRSLLGGVLAEIARRVSGQATGTNVVVVNTGVGSQAGLPQSILDLANQMNQRDVNLPPVVTIKPNAVFTLYVDRDMLFDAPYAPMNAPGGQP